MAPPRTCECGDCPKCKNREYMRAYYRRPGVADRMRATARKSRDLRLGKVRAYDRARGFRGDPQKQRARRKARALSPQPCEICGAGPTARHHDDYTRPLDVRWLCKQHHGEVHRVVAD